jgi:uncharacterized RmlC-like cupin family protein
MIGEEGRQNWYGHKFEGLMEESAGDDVFFYYKVVHRPCPMKRSSPSIIRRL